MSKPRALSHVLVKSSTVISITAIKVGKRVPDVLMRADRDLTHLPAQIPEEDHRPSQDQ